MFNIFLPLLFFLLLAALSEGKRPPCENQDIYLIDGDKTLLLTSSGMTNDLSTIEHSHHNLLRRIRNQDKLIQFLRQRLNYTELQLDESLNLLANQENSFRSTFDKLNSTRMRLDSLRAQNKILEDEHRTDRKTIESNKKELSQLKEKVTTQEREIESLRKNITGGMNKMVESLRVEQNSCENQLRTRETSINQLSEKIIHLEERISICRRTNFRPNDCGLIKAQLNQQDETILLLKDEIQDQEHTMSELQKLLIKKHQVVSEFKKNIKAASSQDHFTIKLTSQDKLIQSQQETIGLLKTVGIDDAELAKAKDQAVKILMNTVQSMVLNIAQCKNNAIDGLQKMIRQLETEKDKMQTTIDNLKIAVSNSEIYGQFQKDLRNSISQLLTIRNKTLTILQSHDNNFGSIESILSERCGHNNNLVHSLDKFYKPANNLTCQNFCERGEGSSPFVPIAEGDSTRNNRQVKCKNIPNLEPNFGLIVSEEALSGVPVGQTLLYSCKNGKELSNGSGRTFGILCLKNGEFEDRRPIPTCVR